MRQEEGSPTPQKDQSSNKEEGSSDKDHQVKRHGVQEKFRESTRQNTQYRPTQGGQEDRPTQEGQEGRTRRQTEEGYGPSHIPGRIAFVELPDGAFYLGIKLHTVGHFDVLLRRANLISSRNNTYSKHTFQYTNIQVLCCFRSWHRRYLDFEYPHSALRFNAVHAMLTSLFILLLDEYFCHKMISQHFNTLDTGPKFDTYSDWGFWDFLLLINILHIILSTQGLRNVRISRTLVSRVIAQLLYSSSATVHGLESYPCQPK